MSDLISRQAAINSLTEYGNGRAVFISVGEAVIRIENLPPAEPNRGTWIDTDSNAEWYAREYRCSECGDTMLGDANFCPNCGADMREVTT